MAKKHTKVLCGVLALTLMAAMLAGCSQKQLPEQTGPANETQGGTEPPANTQPEPSTPLPTEPEGDSYTEPPTQPPVQVVLPEYELSYSGELADRISWQELEDQDGLLFSVSLSAGDMPIFTMLVNQEDGDLVVMKKNGAEERIPIAFQMRSLPEGLSQEEQDIFLFAQDMVNEIVASLVLK